MDVQGKRSQLKPLSNISVIQGSINASFLYTAYNLEVGYLPKIMCNEGEYEELTGNKLKVHENIAHDVLQYVDNRNNSVAANSLAELINYTEDYMLLLKK